MFHTQPPELVQLRDWVRLFGVIRFENLNMVQFSADQKEMNAKPCSRFCYE